MDDVRVFLSFEVSREMVRVFFLGSTELDLERRFC